MPDRINTPDERVLFLPHVCRVSGHKTTFDSAGWWGKLSQVVAFFSQCLTRQFLKI